MSKSKVVNCPYCKEPFGVASDPVVVDADLEKAIHDAAMEHVIGCPEYLANQKASSFERGANFARSFRTSEADKLAPGVKWAIDTLTKHEFTNYGRTVILKEALRQGIKLKGGE